MCNYGNRSILWHVLQNCAQPYIDLLEYCYCLLSRLKKKEFSYNFLNEYISQNEHKYFFPVFYPINSDLEELI